MAKILIIDDDRLFVEVSRKVLVHEGHDVSDAANRQEGKDAVVEHDPDLVILDVIMERPDDGIFLARELRTAGFKKPIIMLTSINRVTGMTYGRDNDLLPIDAFLEKPIAPKLLISTINELLEQPEG